VANNPVESKQHEPYGVEELEQDLVKLQRARAAIAQKVFGHEEVVDQLLVSLMCGGHVLLEGAPGLGKTLLVRTVGEVCGLRFSRVQFTPDLMPSDITGAVVLMHDDRGRTLSEFQPGPIFAEMVLADEINRATPKTQSALLEAMQERTVTVAGRAYALPNPFFVLATQNPIEMEGTYVLPEAQIDRFFFKLHLPYPSEEVLDTILDKTTGSEEVSLQQALTPQDVLRLQRLTREVPLASHVRKTVVRFVLATQPDRHASREEVRTFIRFGVTPRGAQALILAAKAHALLQGRYNVSFGDVRASLLPALRHRFQLNYEGVAEGVSAEKLLQSLFDQAVDAASV
jgi:MoxR-like ATPase